ncbi:MAG: GspMb/PilO family protein [Verrucomicrobiales bacterium]|nr:GspMb/PilO family protein [Verrucomicrobiales bacterium]
MKSTHHTQAIGIFGVALPFLVVAILLGATLYGRGKVAVEFDRKTATFERYQEAKVQANELEAYMTKEQRREKVLYWNEKLEQDFIQSLTTNLEGILDKYDSNVLRQTELSQAQGAGAIASRTDNPHSRIQLSFEGGFKPMQMLLAELEREMPHLFLESIMIRPNLAKSETEAGSLSFSLVYMCWEKPKS